MSADRRYGYREAEILEADPCRLVALLLRNLIDRLADARAAVAAGDIRRRSSQITRAGEILNELAQSVDHTAGGEIGRNLVEIYDYLQRLLQRANFEQVAPPLVEAEGILRMLLEAWEQGLDGSGQPGPHAPAHDADYEPVSCLG
jgi:flagellar protein FliS